ncbi:MAG: dienelactone hydrolase family protein [Aeromicrobium sp.]
MGNWEQLRAGGVSARNYLAGDAASSSGGVVLLHPWWGLNEDVVAYADRLAGAGFAVAAPDMFDGQVATTVEDAERLARAADEEQINGIVLAAVDDLARRLGPGAKVAVLGLSFGAHWAIWSPSKRESVVASVLYYGTTGDALTDSKAPVLGHFAEDDPYEEAAWVAEFETTLRSAGREVVIHRYPKAGHWFAEPSRDAYRPDAADLAFARTVEFLEERLGTPTR